MRLAIALTVILWNTGCENTNGQQLKSDDHETIPTWGIINNARPIHVGALVHITQLFQSDTTQCNSSDTIAHGFFSKQKYITIPSSYYLPDSQTRNSSGVLLWDLRANGGWDKFLHERPIYDSEPNSCSLIRVFTQSKIYPDSSAIPYYILSVSRCRFTTALLVKTLDYNGIQQSSESLSRVTLNPFNYLQINWNIPPQFKHTFWGCELDDGMHTDGQRCLVNNTLIGNGVLVEQLSHGKYRFMRGSGVALRELMPSIYDYIINNFPSSRIAHDYLFWNAAQMEEECDFDTLRYHQKIIKLLNYQNFKPRRSGKI